MDKVRKLCYNIVLYIALFSREATVLIDTFALGQLSTNVYLITDAENNALLIDPADGADFLTNEIKSRNLTLRAILLTHAHFDHMGAMQSLRQTFRAPVYVHEQDAAAVHDPQKDGSLFFGLPPQSNTPADHTVTDGQTLTFGNLTLSVLHTPGHTPGSVCYAYTEMVQHLFCGDTIFAGSCGRSDLPGGNAHTLRQSLARIASLPDSCVIHPGHGRSSDIATERAINPYIPRNFQL